MKLLAELPACPVAISTNTISIACERDRSGYLNHHSIILAVADSWFPEIKVVCIKMCGQRRWQENALNLQLVESCCNPVKTKHLYNFHTMLVQRRRRWADIVSMLYKCFVFAGKRRESLFPKARC